MTNEHVPQDVMQDETPALETPATTPSEPVETAVENTETQQTEQTQVETKPKLHTQDEVDAIVQKEKAKAEARAERRAEKAYRNILERLVPPAQAAQPVVQPQIERPNPANFADTDAYIEAITDWKFSQREQATRQTQETQRHRDLTVKTEAIYRQAHEIPIFDREVFDALPLTPAIQAAIIDSDVAAKLMAYMSTNPDEVQRISALVPARQAAEIGKMEAKLSLAPSTPKPSNAPAPINPVGANRGGNKDWTELTPEEHAAARRKRLAQKT